MRSHRFAVITVTALLAWPALHATAGPPDDAAAATRSNPFGATARAVSTEKLEGVRGGAETVVNDMKLHGTVADNAAINVRSGSNAIADGSFANSAGLPTVIQNTGSNVLIQNATILNVQFK
ncbi:hypothetical protein [Cupriavidus plantarum]|uniref:Uncharacterized protein n=1 Tax=Cupriavidus plantarum TaxID=942865 RepID=A0A316EKY9_9BURK|nr:hypothetical protein [Cupriavidus plantarum]NYI02200.1 hypothetical protein [Cupriavidus plantarum]PWK33142.1 hypothetical protein C7419_105136 [Cupriavidus plantarum]RLK31142.1 hypothetical protein C7417_4996 [Cupriavidus plantarum]CAG2153519.1 hypothetical protein LMG26296_05335 [Cupriavidus plantarum]SMR86255.1 hypothetical protein SAMN05421735_5078 [Cupriavidus plantarum]